MALQTQQISKYVRDTEYNIIRADKSISGVWSFAVDTGNIFLTYQGALIQWNPRDTKLTDYTIGTDHYRCQPLLHVDASDVTTLKNINFQPPVDGQSIVELSSVANGGADKLEQLSGSRTPIFKADQLGNSLHSLRFSNGAFMSTDSVFNTTTHGGAFTVLMVVKLLPTWKSWNRYGLNDSANVEGKDNEWLNGVTSPGSNFSFGLFQGKTRTTYTSYTQNIGAGLRFTSTANNWRVEPGIAGNMFRQADNQEGDLESKMWGSYSNPLEHIGDDPLTDTMILCWEFPDTNDSPRAGHRTRISTAGKGKVYDMIASYPSLVNGFDVGRFNGWFTGDGGHFDLGEMLVFNNMFDKSSLNNLGNHLSSKWNATWINFD